MPAISLPVLTPYLATAGIGWVVYRRIRRSFGRQPWQPKRTIFRITLMALLLGLLMMAAIFLPGVAGGIAGGGTAGLVLGGFALRHTRVERYEGRLTYVPNPWIGSVLAALLLGRLIWRWTQGAFADGAAAVTAQASPLTMMFAAMLVGYYLFLNGGLWWRMRRLTVDDRP